MSTLDMIGWTAMILGAVGALFNVNKKSSGFVFYIAANTLMVTVGILKSEWYNVAFFALMTGVAAYGLWSWRKKCPDGGIGRRAGLKIQ